jgi:prevent-host-death family protein
MARRPDRSPNAWTMTEARARFEEIVDRAFEVGPHLITCRGKPRVYVVSAEDWRRRQAGLPLVHEEQESP